MPRANKGPSLEWIADRGVYYVKWYERGIRKVRSTSTSDRREAEKSLADFIGQSHRKAGGPRDPSDVQIVDVLDLYGTEKAPHAAAPERIGYAISALIPYWQANKVSDIKEDTCRKYLKERKRAQRRVDVPTAQLATQPRKRPARKTAAPES